VLAARIRGSRGAIGAAFGAALTDHVAALSSNAALLPAGFTADDAANLDPPTFAARTRARDAHAALQAARAASALSTATGALHC
jgi:hypothetical protein